MSQYTNIAEVPAPAKINLCLLVGPRRADGYHPVFSVMEKIMLFDTLRVTPEAEGAGIRLTGSEIPPRENIVMRAAEALERETGRRFDVDIELKKTIPAAAGLAGGSSDAAAILKLLIFALGLEVPDGRLREIALELGADVPFFLGSGPRLTRGIGEQLGPLPGAAQRLPEYAVVVVKPRIDLSTAEVYALFDAIGGAGAAADSDSADVLPGASAHSAFEENCLELQELLAGVTDVASLAAILRNDLEPAARQLFEGLDALKQDILDAGALGALMSGSGSSVFGLFETIETAESAAGRLGKSHQRVWAARVFREQ